VLLNDFDFILKFAKIFDNLKIVDTVDEEADSVLTDELEVTFLV
jgi:hypothetical protein